LLGPAPSGDAYTYWKHDWDAIHANAYDTDKQTAQTIIDHWAGQAYPQSDYEQNLKVIASRETCLWREIGFAASMAPAYTRTTERTQKQEQPKESQHVGQLKDRIILNDARVTGIYGFESLYGPGDIVKFTLPNGSRLVWFTSTEPDVEKGQEYRIKATIKAHTEYRGTPETTITRVKILSTPKP
jgi:hypothetical protein